MIKMNPKVGNETKSDIIPKENVKSDVILLFIIKTLKYFRDFESQNFSIL